MPRHRVDVHSHYLGGTVAQVLRSGFSLAGGYRMSVRWSPEEAIAYMDRQGVATQILSTPWTFTGSEDDPDLAKRVARAVNEEYAELIAKYPGRFGAFAALLGDSTDAMLEELEHALDTLHLDGVMLNSNTQGRYLGFDWYEPLLAELNRRGVPVFLHPADSPVIVDQLGFGRPSSVCEFTFDTARNVINAVYRGVFQRYPDLRLILAHCGGPLPTLGWRIAEHTTMGMGPDDADIDPAHVTEVLSKLYYETALAGSRNSLLPTLEVTDTDHVLFGTDWPAAPERTTVHNIENLMTSGLLTDQQLEDVESGNARRLFPRLSLS
ncbi:amidohydrolase family protein [Streptomyces sp. NPDC096311]|uniref:amidohydrolase family protein n=1 Tax=Streptomyces sp. NPDC096311 TaxID=3366083 RepID=UPI003814A161